jgi:NAD(P)-dependent dehydrogenase (short-subunit alcohol dehydrogenase family)
VVTGASSGIGAATARALAGAGHPVVLGARRRDACEQVAAGIRAEGGEARALLVDLADAGSVAAFADEARAALGAVEIVVSSAGRISPTPALATDEDTFAGVLEVNVLGAHRLVRAFGPAMVERARGDLVFVTSETVRVPRPHMSPYVSSKWGLEGFVQALQMELEGTGVRASIVRPGQTRTAMGFDWDPEVTASAIDEWVRWGAARHDHFLPPESVASAVLAVVGVPRGTHFPLIEVQPEGPPPKPEEGEPRSAEHEDGR